MEDVIAEGQAEADTRRLTPGVISSYRNTWRQLCKYFLLLILFLLVIEATYFLFSYIVYEFISGDLQLLAVSLAYYFLVSIPLGFAWAYVTLRATRKEKVGIKNLFEPFRYYHNMVLAAIIYTALVYIPSIIFSLVVVFVPVLAIILLVPLVIFAITMFCRLAFLPFLVTDRGLNVFRAIKTSWNMSDRHAGKVFIIVLLGIPVLAVANILLDHDIFLAGLICLVIGVIISLWMYLALAFLYHTVDTDPWASSPKPFGPSEYRRPGY